jgi:hypothetical protein
LKYAINSHNDQLMLYGLTYQHAVKWITMHRWKRGQLTDAGFIKRQAGNLVPFTLG